MQIHRDLDRLPTWPNPVITIGSFDGVHNGHRTILAQLIEQAKAVGGTSVLVTFEPHPRLVIAQTAAQAPFQLLNTLEEKIILLRATGLDHVVVVPFDAAFSSLSAEAYLRDFLFQRFEPHTIMIGYDHRYGHDRSGDIQTLQAWAAGTQTRIIEIPAKAIDEVTISSTRIRQAILASDFELATKLLGAPFLIAGQVVHGDHLGRTIGYPTANVAITTQHKLLPPDGIYACTVATQANETYVGMLYLGTRPVVSGAREHRVEVHLLDYEGDLYGQEIQISISKWMRGDMQLPNLAALQAQIDADKLAITSYFTQKTETQTRPVTKDNRAEVAIVILNYNTAKHLATFLPSVKAHSQGARIIVADNGSPDDSVAYLRQVHPDVEVLDLGTNYGFAGGYNHALRQVHATTYVILNSDVEVTAGWLDAPLALLAEDETVAIVQPKIKAYRQKTHFEYAGAAGGWLDVLAYPFCRGRIFSHTEADLGQYDTVQECFWAAGAAFFIRAELYHTFEGFDADYFAHNEEIDLCWRIKRAGYRVMCTPNSVVYHLGGGTLEYESPRKVFLNFRNSLYTLLKNGEPTYLMWAIPARLLLDGLAGVRFLLKGQFRSIWSIVEAHFSFYAHFGSTITKRKHTQTIIAKHQIDASPNLAGMTNSSMVWRFYARGKKNYEL
jgi:riboflavin kinase/FMN adenylyltransferase